MCYQSFKKVASTCFHIHHISLGELTSFPSPDSLSPLSHTLSSLLRLIIPLPDSFLSSFLNRLLAAPGFWSIHLCSSSLISATHLNHFPLKQPEFSLMDNKAKMNLPPGYQFQLHRATTAIATQDIQKYAHFFLFVGTGVYRATGLVHKPLGLCYQLEKQDCSEQREFSVTLSFSTHASPHSFQMYLFLINVTDFRWGELKFKG